MECSQCLASTDAIYKIAKTTPNYICLQNVTLYNAAVTIPCQKLLF